MAISLQKGQRINLEKDGGGELSQMCVGVNWGAIEGKGLFGGKKKEAVDLDASCVTFDANKQALEIVYFGQLRGQGIHHSGDDRTGDMDGDDGLDNEVIMVNLNEVSPAVEQIIFVLNSFQGHDFKTIPFASIRLYEGTPSRVDNIHAKFDIANDPQFAGSVSMVLGKLYKNNGKWKFTAIGETTRDRELKNTIQTVQTQFL
ncbi:tellurium resistance protein TerZ [Nitrosomonas cryotolerans]|uniref:Tellurium resistance protein TerZ n=1 Tax=Nitrosomonas cryotolerans ATCC 49181 TaxID=1131553 RepID=A0A1N6JJ13_9PROT|nr:TerD family protein [Nitrosomonas cryotolerans]SFP89198.1 tellurium resistance protein TerZ [Nitrosomonas cryotolerans]SIO44181.1 tellurium resistance protein TerZ [Nitrosomonas cryotolerans ATCC 49181]